NGRATKAQPRQRNRATIPYTHGKRLRPLARARSHRSERAARGSAALTLRSAGPLRSVADDKRKQSVRCPPSSARSSLPAMSNVAFGTTRQAIAARDRSLPGRVTGKLYRAIDAMVWAGSSRKEAAQMAGLSDHGLRQALRRPHVLAFYLSECEVLRLSGRA